MLAPPAAFGFTLTASVGVVNGVHDHAADAWASSEPAVAACFAEGTVLVFAIADDTDGGAAFGVDVALFARGHFEDGAVAFDAEELGKNPCAACNLGAFARFELDGVDECGWGDVTEFERKACGKFRGGVCCAEEGVSDLESVRGEDVAFFTVSVLEEGDVGSAIGIVFEGLNGGGDVEFVAPEINVAVEAFVSAATAA